MRTEVYGLIFEPGAFWTRSRVVNRSTPTFSNSTKSLVFKIDGKTISKPITLMYIGRSHFRRGLFTSHLGSQKCPYWTNVDQSPSDAQWRIFTSFGGTQISLSYSHKSDTGPLSSPWPPTLFLPSTTRSSKGLFFSGFSTKPTYAFIMYQKHSGSLSALIAWILLP